MRRLLTCVALLAAVPLAASAQTIGAAGWPSERAPRPLASRPVAFPPYQLKTLANGLQVLAIPWHEQPSVSMRLIIKAGASQDPQDKPGVANMVASLLNQGTTMKSAEGIANLVESSGGVLGVGAGNEWLRQRRRDQGQSGRADGAVGRAGAATGLRPARTRSSEAAGMWACR
jgi:hypothetical protein